MLLIKENQELKAEIVRYNEREGNLLNYNIYFNFSKKKEVYGTESKCQQKFIFTK